MARSYAGVSEKNHFGSDAFVANGRIFATVWADKKEVNLMLNQEQQRAFLLRDESEGFRPIENAWGKNAINVQLESVDADIFWEALQTAWTESAHKRSGKRGPSSKAR